MSAKKVDYRAVLADLEEKRRAIDDGIRAVRELLGQSADKAENNASREPQAKSPGGFTGITLGDAAYEYLKSVNEPQTISELAAGLEASGFHHGSRHFGNTLRVALIRREGREPGDFKRFRKKWGLAEWTPRRGRRPSKNQHDEEHQDEMVGDVPAAVEFGRVAAAPVNALRQQTHRCQEISVCF